MTINQFAIVGMVWTALVYTTGVFLGKWHERKKQVRDEERTMEINRGIVNQAIDRARLMLDLHWVDDEQRLTYYQYVKEYLDQHFRLNQRN